VSDNAQFVVTVAGRLPGDRASSPGRAWTFGPLPGSKAEEFHQAILRDLVDFTKFGTSEGQTIRDVIDNGGFVVSRRLVAVTPVVPTDTLFTVESQYPR
jgi:hypothetical protein